MPSASRPDPSQSPAEDGEVVEVFHGDTLEEAMAAAVAALGPDLAVRRARKVRAGVRGLLGRDRYEVLAVPPDGPTARRAAPDDPEDAVGSALEALLEAADQREAGGPPARPVGRPSASRPLAARPADDLPPPLRRPAAGAPAPLPPAPRSGGSPLRRTRPAPPPAAPAAPVAPPATQAGSTPAPPVPEPAGAPDAAGLDGRDLEPPVVAQAEDRRTPSPLRRRGRTAGPLADSSPHPDPAVADHPEPPAPSRRRGRRTAGAEDAGPAPAEAAPAEPTPTPALTPAPAERPRAAAPGTAPAAAAARPVARRGRTGGWSRAALAGLGVPEQVLDALPTPAPRDDLAWVVALTAAIEATVPPPAEPDEQTPVVVSGHGLAGALAVLDAGCRGIAPGTISSAGRTAPATATELALVLRHHVTSGS